MKKLIIAASLFFGACGAITSALPTTQGVNGDTWYVKSKGMGFLVIGADVYYCPKETPTKCEKATWQAPTAKK